MATIKDVARLAGVSITTVSHVINDTRYVSDELKTRVHQAMQDLNYRPNILARSLRSGETQTIGLIVPDSANLFFAEIAKVIEDIGFSNGYSVVLCNSSNSLEKERAYIKTLINKQVDGAIFISSGGSHTDIQDLIEAKIPTVIVDRDIQAEFVDVVLLDNEHGGYIATKHLIELGHTQIACITGPNELTPSIRRLEGYRRALHEANLPVEPAHILEGDFQYQSGFDLTEHLLTSDCPTSAIFACNDMMALGVLNAAYRWRLRVPEDLAIVGFDDIQMTHAIFPTLTTVSQLISQMGETSINLLLQRIRNASYLAPQRVTLTPELVVRESTVGLINLR